MSPLSLRYFALALSLSLTRPTSTTFDIVSQNFRPFVFCRGLPCVTGECLIISTLALELLVGWLGGVRCSSWRRPLGVMAALLQDHQLKKVAVVSLTDDGCEGNTDGAENQQCHADQPAR